jgi:type I restriction-modification system DNA methylase subunit
MDDLEGSRAKIEELVKKYSRIVEEKRDGRYNEEMTKKDLILPLFRALGWNVEDSNEVTAEENVSKKRVDYGFRISGIPKFFLEAKSLREDLDNRKFIEQAINYAWHKGCTWAVLSNFETVRIFNAEWKTASPWQTHLKTIHSYEFLKRFDELWLLSKQSFEQGLIDKEAEKWGKKTKKTSVDKQLLADFTRFRELLSKNITKLNQGRNITEEDLDEAIQRILDRLIFIRNCEDRELEAKTLISNLREWESRGRGQLVKSLREVFGYFDKTYNSKIFSEHLCDDLEIDDAVLHQIIEGLYYTKDKAISYDFSAIDADVLGTIYEQYLSHILKKTEKRAKLTENHAHRKEQGIYYTPTYIVDYIVRSTLGKLLEGKRAHVERIRVLDPACGSGSFLIKAFDILNENYKKKDEDYSQTQLDLKTGIAFTKKVKILRNNIFGVDLDKQAVEIAQLNLLLKITEKGHRLPLLEQNIKCGNSLIDDEELAGNEAFKWKEEFAEALKEGGFDVVIGNPPYINAIQLTKTVGEEVKEYWKKKYYTARGAYDIFVLFFEQSLSVCKKDGFVSFITPNKYLSSPYGVALREFISKNFRLVKVLDLSKVKVFDDPSVYPIITIIQKTKPEKEYAITTERIFSENIENRKTYEISSRNLTILPDYNWGIILSDNVKIIEKVLEKCEPLEKVAIVQATSTASEADEYAEYIKETNKGLPIINTGTIDRYSTTYGITQFMHKGRQFKKPVLDISKVNDSRRGLYETPKIIISKLALRIEGFLDREGEYASINTNCIHSPKKGFSIEYLAGIINSRLMSFVYSELFSGLKMSGGYFQFQAPQLRILPIAHASEEQWNKMSVLVNRIVSLNQQLNEIGDKRTDERARIEEDVKKTDAEIDDMVYKIYGMTEPEKEIIENSLK